ncbi:hypothetical protein B0J11DRAFT_495293 [Dendryphion nanum]|uniref:Postreplication repair E3 ubiquitin-protein ligase RAD18 n=1 Tax=Dendryphion nanum TaxID=256645 RepID=A0A9P9IDP1_9PLEO|nr:hypothetical protein B0J11DRAFT_495293 [Dendryphion nanum]
MDTSLDISDSTDWLQSSLPGFAPLEVALRCEICKDFYVNPVITSCSHTFCSLCIRQSISRDGKCPQCRSSVQADRLLANQSVREVVDLFQASRTQALELARKDKEDEEIGLSARKRKLDDTDIEEGEPIRQTRSRQTRSQNHRNHGLSSTPIEVPDSEDDGDDEFIPDGLVRCPVCKTPMKEEQVYLHLDTCTGEQEPVPKRSTRSKTTVIFPGRPRNPPKEASPAPTRLPGLNYALFKEQPLARKLKEIGIPHNGRKDLLVRRHIEWVNLWNANCDSSESNRKSKRELLKELDIWERTQGGQAGIKDSEFMKKDFDGRGHMATHKNQFDDLIANARKNRSRRKSEENKDETQTNITESLGSEPSSLQVPVQRPTVEREQSMNSENPYEGNESALASIRAKVEEANQNGTALPSLSREVSEMDEQAANAPKEIGIANPFGSPSRKMPMFTVPSRPVSDVDQSTNSV